MATYSNQHWLLSHIRNSFISTDDTGICETVMVSNDLPKHYLQRFQADSSNNSGAGYQRKSLGINGAASKATSRAVDPPLQEVDFICYPGLDQSDDEDMDLATQSFDIQMYPEVGAHRFRSNTAQKLEKMDIARRKAARTKCVIFDDEIMTPERSDFFLKKPVKVSSNSASAADDDNGGVRSKLSLQLANSPKQAQNKYMEYARFDGTSQSGIQTKRINVFLAMLPERERNYPIKICVIASAKIIEVIGFVCYKATIQYPDIPLKSIRNYALYMTEDNDNMDDFPPLDNREPCSKFGFSHLTLAERRPLAPVTSIDYHNNLATKSMTSEEDKARLAAAAVRSLQNIELNGGNTEEKPNVIVPDKLNDYEERMLSHNEVLEAPMYRTFRLHIIDKRFFKTEVTLGISGERIDIDQHKNAKFWTKQKAVTYPIDAIAICEIVESRRPQKAIVRVWLKSNSSITSAGNDAAGKSGALPVPGTPSGSMNGMAHSPTSPGHYPNISSPFAFFSSNTSSGGGGGQHQTHIRFKHYDFEADLYTSEQIRTKLNCILEVRSSELRREFMQLRERKLERNQAKKQLKM